MTRTRRPPTFMPGMPWSQPWMTWPWPIVNANGWRPFCQEVSNSLPVSKSVPTYCTVTLSPDLASAPVPVTTSEAWSSLGAVPVAFGTVGFLDRSVLTPVTFFCSGGGSPGWRGLTVDLVDAASAGSVGDGSPSILERSLRKPSGLLPPQPATIPAASDRTLKDRAMERVLVMRRAAC